MEQLNCVQGSCKESLEEEIAAYINVPVKLITWHPTNDWVHIELQECVGLSNETIKEWQRMEIHHDGFVFCFCQMFFGNNIFEGNPYGYSQRDGSAVAIRFRRHQRLN